MISNTTDPNFCDAAAIRIHAKRRDTRMKVETYLKIMRNTNGAVNGVGDGNGVGVRMNDLVNCVSKDIFDG